MTKVQFIKLLQQQTDLSQQQAEAFFRAFWQIVAEQLKSGEEVTFPGIGAFKVKHRAARTATNPRTGKTLKVPAKDVPTFRFSQKFFK